MSDGVLLKRSESKGQVSSGEGRVFPSAERCLQEDRQEMGVEGSSLLRCAASVTQGDLLTYWLHNSS